MKKSLSKVFVCGTYVDLLEERRSVVSALEAIGIEPVSMEGFGARTDRPIATCLSEVKRSDFVIVLVAHLYGSLVPKVGISFSQTEYSEARKHNKPVLVYFRDEEIPVAPKYMESDPEKLKMLRAFKFTLQEHHTVAMFTSSDGLAQQVTMDVERLVAAERDTVVSSEPASTQLGQRYKQACDAIENNDFPAAFDLSFSLAEGGHSASQRNLGLLYGGRGGDSEDIQLAMYWLMRAANSGDIPANRLLKAQGLADLCWLDPVATSNERDFDQDELSV